MPYYCTIGGWVVKYFFVFLTGHGADAAQDGFFTGFITSQWEPIITFVIFLAVSAFIVFRGVNKGIESTSKIIMPILLVMILGIAIFSLTLKNTNDAGEVVTGLQGFKDTSFKFRGTDNRKVIYGSDRCTRTVVLQLVCGNGYHDYIWFVCEG